MLGHSKSVNTLALRTIDTNRIVNAIQNNRQVTMEHIGEGVLAITDKRADIPAFNHPVWVEADETEKLMVDVRSTLSATREGGVRIRNSEEHTFRVMRAAIEYKWETDIEFRNILRNNSDIGCKVFGAMVSEALSRQYGLGPGLQVRLEAIASAYFLLMMEEDFTDQTRVKIIAKASRVTRINAELYDEVFLINGVESGTIRINHLANDIVALDDPRLNKVNAAFLFGLLGSGWFTDSGNEVACASLELPHLYLLMVATSTMSKTQRRSRISQIIDRRMKKDKSQISSLTVALARYANTGERQW